MHMCFESIAFKMYTKRSAGAIMIQRLLRKYAVQQQQRLGTISREAQKAVWARHLIGVIEGASAPRSLRSQSLREKVLELQAPSKEFEFCAAVRTEMLSPFGVGIELPPFARHLDALAKGTQQGSPRKYVFCPTVLTTKPIFRYLEREAREDIFVWGPPGIAKTASVILYLHLNSYIARFYFEAQSDAAKLEELRELQRRQLLSNTAFKYFYWGLTNNDHKAKRLIQSLIVEQATELDEAARSALKNQIDPLEFCRLLHSQYPQNIELRTIIDSFQKFQRIMLSFNSSPIDSSSSECVQQEKKLTNMIKQTVQLDSQIKIRELAYLLRFIQYQTHSKTVISSFPLSQKHLERSKQFCLQLGFSCMSLTYEWSLLEAEYQFQKIIWFKIQSILRLKEANSVIISKIQAIFLSKVHRYLIINSYYKISYINNVLDQYQKNFLNITSETSEQAITTVVKSFLEELANKSINFESLHFQGLLAHANPQERSIFRIIHSLALFQRNVHPNQLMLFEREKLQASPYVKGFFRKSSLNSQRISNNLIPFRMKQNEVIMLPWTPFSYLSWTTDHLYPKTDNQVQVMYSQSDKLKFKEIGPALGIELEFQLRMCMEVGVQIAFIKYFFEDKQIVRQDKFKIYSRTTFFHLNRPDHTGELCIMSSNFRKAIEQAKFNPGKACIAFPITFYGTHSYRSRLIDFLTVLYNSQSDSLTLNTFDVTITTQISQKIEKAKIFYKFQIMNNLSKFNVSKSISLVHTTICPRTAIIETEPLKWKGYRCLFEFIDNNTIRLTGCSNEEAQKKYIELQTIVHTLPKSKKQL